MPLREGGSLPGVMEADDLGTYVVKFRGAGQGRKVLVAEVVVGGLARALGLPLLVLVLVLVQAAERLEKRTPRPRWSGCSTLWSAEVGLSGGAAEMSTWWRSGGIARR